MKNYFIKTGFWDTFKIGRKAPGLHLNKMVRDVLRDCGIPCFKCNEGDCNAPQVSLVTSRNVEYINTAGDKMTATVIDLERYADLAAAQADNLPTNSWFINLSTGAVQVVL